MLVLHITTTYCYTCICIGVLHRSVIEKTDVRPRTAICRNVEHNELHPEKRKIKINFPEAPWSLIHLITILVANNGFFGKR